MNLPIKRSRYYHFASIIITLVLNLILNLNLVVNRICLPDFIAHIFLSITPNISCNMSQHNISSEIEAMLHWTCNYFCSRCINASSMLLFDKTAFHICYFLSKLTAWVSAFFRNVLYTRHSAVSFLAGLKLYTS